MAVSIGSVESPYAQLLESHLVDYNQSVDKATVAESIRNKSGGHATVFA